VNINYRKSLFKLEQWSPHLARRFWGIASLLEAPSFFAMGFKINALTDLNAEIEVPLTRINKSENGALHTSVLIAAGEQVTRVLWLRHLRKELEELRLDSIHCRFLKPGSTPVRVRTELGEPERERILRKLRAGGEADCEMAVIMTDEKDQQIAGLNCIWHLKPIRPLTTLPPAIF
jgi:hypothetical protein